MKKLRKEWLCLLKTHEPDRADTLFRQIDDTFSLLVEDVAFAKRSKNPMDRSLPMAAYLLAVIKVLDQHAFDRARIRKLLLELTYQYARPKNDLQQYVRRCVPGLLTSSVGRILLRRMNRWINKAPLADGFLIKLVTDEEETLGFGYGVDIRECGICKLFAKHRYQHYAPLLCEVDYITSALAGLQLVRSGTIANGAAKCDFRYQSIK